jgi:hypothetical protein
MIRKFVFILVLFFAAVTVSWPVEVLARGGLEAGQQSIDGGWGLSGFAAAEANFQLKGPVAVSAGIRLGAGGDFQDIVSLEPLAFARLNVTAKKKSPEITVFAEADIGAYLLFINSGSPWIAKRGGKFQPAVSAGGALGARFKFGRGFFAEPYARYAYPAGFGAGAAFGWTFAGREKGEGK